MKYLAPLLIFSALIFFQYCKSSKYTPDNYPASQIVFGSGGGVAGLYTNYYVFDNGQIFTNTTTEKKYKKIKKTTRDVVAQIYSNYDNLNLKDYQLNDPGNITYYMEFREKDKIHKISWGGKNEKVNPNVETLYQILNQLIKK